LQISWNHADTSELALFADLFQQAL
jgi:hypothetical protein